jgi:release factor glutamine methyltransferase
VVLARANAVRKLLILDVGTGSGCLAVTLAAELPLARVIASDTSGPALHVARRNAIRHGVASRLSLVRADLLDPISGPFDIVVSNPPYVPLGAALPPEVARYEPAPALFAGGDGLEALRRLLPATRAILAPHGVFVVEFGFGQAEAVRALARAAGWTRIDIHPDLQGIPRVCVMSTDVNVTEG